MWPFWHQKFAGISRQVEGPSAAPTLDHFFPGSSFCTATNHCRLSDICFKRWQSTLCQQPVETLWRILVRVSISAYCPDPSHHPILLNTMFQLRREGTHHTTLLPVCPISCSAGASSPVAYSSVVARPVLALVRLRTVHTHYMCRCRQLSLNLVLLLLQSSLTPYWDGSMFFSPSNNE